MEVRNVLMTDARLATRTVSVETAASMLEELSGAYAREIACDLRGGISYECDGFTFVPDVIAEAGIYPRSTFPLSPVQRAPFPAGRKS